MINKKLDEISAKLDTINVLVQDNEYLENVEKRCDEVNEKNTQALKVALERFEIIQKAIDYIENEAITENLHTDHTYITINKEDLLDILKGVNNE